MTYRHTSESGRVARLKNGGYVQLPRAPSTCCFGSHPGDWSAFQDYEIRIAASDGLTEPIRMRSGLPQGHVLSPFLFNLYLDDLLKQLERSPQEDLQAPGQDDTARVLAYADDVVIYCPTSSGLRKLLQVFTPIGYLAPITSRHTPEDGLP